MKTIGMIGGMSWESSIEYYRIINESIRSKIGGLHSAKSVMFSVDFAEIEALQHQGKWDHATDLMIDAAKSVENGGADFVIICTNTMHKMADEVQKHIRIPLLHIADATAEKIKSRGMSRVGLLGTRFTMEEGEKRAYQEKIETQLKGFAAKIEELVAKGEKAKEEAKLKYAQQIEALRAKQESVRQKLQGLKEPGGAAWDDLKKGIDSAIGDLKVAVQSAVSRFKEKEEPIPGGDVTESDET